MKKLKIIITVLVLTIGLTAASLLYVHPGENYCAPSNPGPLDELAIIRVEKRGFPFPYIVNSDSDNYCQLSGNAVIVPGPLLIDLLIWSVPSAVVTAFVVLKRRSR